MITVNKLIPRGQGLAPALVKRASSLSLDAQQCRQSRLQLSDQQGRALDIALPEGSLLRDGDVLVAEDGSLILVQSPLHHEPGACSASHAHDHHDHAHGHAQVPHVHGPGCKH
ncbi:hypothetical protein [Paucibacter soli]|uniref:hypothetical protein n=1 Tax=Paucibacter soli TaxID=3133433 RepID=UPI0030A58B5D